MIARTITERHHFKAAILANKRMIVFCKFFLLHKYLRILYFLWYKLAYHHTVLFYVCQVYSFIHVVFIVVKINIWILADIKNFRVLFLTVRFPFLFLLWCLKPGVCFSAVFCYGLFFILEIFLNFIEFLHKLCDTTSE